MIRLKTMLLLTILFLNGCSSNTGSATENENSGNKLGDDSVGKKMVVQHSINKKFITDDNFVFEVIDNNLTLPFIESASTLLEKSIVSNLHNKSVNDTILKFGDGTNFFKFYKAQENTILTEAEITTDKYNIGSISVGVSYNVVQTRFKVIEVVDTLILKDFENSAYFMFLFERDTLRKVVFSTRYLD